LPRISGKRPLAKMNAFDLVVTVALGSTPATILLSKDVALAEGGLPFAVLIALQFAIAWLPVRSAVVRRLVKAEPARLLYQGWWLWGAMAAERVTAEEIRAAVRAQGIGTLGVLITTGLSLCQLRVGEAFTSAYHQYRRRPQSSDPPRARVPGRCR
jgi:uncharacterized membrane protein YcaP (DUF421 family)